LIIFLFNRYADRAKSIKNHARVNEDPKDAMIRNLENEIQLLRKQVEEGLLSSFHILQLNKSYTYSRWWR
jgi:hypothetical protein